jgi:uncharacterized protein YggE
MPSLHRAALLLLVAACGTTGSLVAQGGSDESPSGIRTRGSSEITLRPDWAVLRAGVEVHAGTASAASSQLSRTVRALRDALRGQGLPQDSLETVRFAVGPNYNYREGRKLVDYQGVAVVQVTVRQLDRVGAIVDAALAAGATDIPLITYASAAEDSARRVALGRALVEARADASALAEASGGRLGPLLEVSTTPESRGRIGLLSEFTELAGGRLALETAALTPKDVVVRVEVFARWALQTPGW